MDKTNKTNIINEQSDTNIMKQLSDTAKMHGREDDMFLVNFNTSKLDDFNNISPEVANSIKSNIGIKVMLKFNENDDHSVE
jgi:hypothetical protein